MGSLALMGAGPGAGGGAAPFTPSSIAGLAAWYKADAGTSTTTDGTGVSQWNDQSSNASNAVQATGGSQPIYKAAIQNGLPVLRFNGTSQFMEASAVSVSQPSTIFMVASSGGGANRNAIDGITNRQALLSDGSSHIAMYAGTAVSSTTAWVAAQFVCLSAVFNGASSQLWRNGTSIVTGNAGATALTGLRIGSFNGVSADWDGDIGEILVYTGALSTTDRQSVESYLRTRWGTA